MEQYSVWYIILNFSDKNWGIGKFIYQPIPTIVKVIEFKQNTMRKIVTTYTLMLELLQLKKVYKIEYSLKD